MTAHSLLPVLLLSAVIQAWVWLPRPWEGSDSYYCNQLQQSSCASYPCHLAQCRAAAAQQLAWVGLLGETLEQGEIGKGDGLQGWEDPGAATTERERCAVIMMEFPSFVDAEVLGSPTTTSKW